MSGRGIKRNLAEDAMRVQCDPRKRRLSGRICDLRRLHLDFAWVNRARFSCMPSGIDDSEAHDAEHNGKAYESHGLLEVLVSDRDGNLQRADPNRTYRRAAAYWDRAEHRMRLEYEVEAWAKCPDCYARFQSGRRVAYGDSIPELRAIAERELPLLVAAIERRVRMAMGDTSGSILGDV